MADKRMKIRVVFGEEAEGNEGEMYVNIHDLIQKLISTRDANKEGGKEIRAKCFHDTAEWLHGMLEAYGANQFEEFKREGENEAPTSNSDND